MSDTPRLSLATFGPYADRESAEATLEIAVEELLSSGGGVLLIPHDAPADFVPRNSVERRTATGSVTGVTIEDSRAGVTRIFVPPGGAPNSENTARGGLIVERDVSQTLRPMGVASTVLVSSRYAGGASSYYQRLFRDVAAGENRHFYLPSIVGLFVGQQLWVKPPNAPVVVVTVARLGHDRDGSFMIADTTKDLPAGSPVYNKNVVNGMRISDSSNCDNQSTSLILERRTYGRGDSFGVAAALHYQSEIMSGGGDEGSVAMASEIVPDMDVFKGTVESWSSETNELVYAPIAKIPEDGQHAHKIGMSRPLINMNQDKWLFAEGIIIEPGIDYLREGPLQAEANRARKSFSLTILSRPKDIDERWIGRFIAVIDEPEIYKPGESWPAPGVGAKPKEQIHRWHRISAIERRSDGDTNIYVERTYWENPHISKGGISLFRSENYTRSAEDAHSLRFAIAPGGFVADPRDGAAMLEPGRFGAARRSHPRLIRLTPSALNPAMAEEWFEEGDPIMNPVGPSPWLPVGFRVRHFNTMPGMRRTGFSFQGRNSGHVQLHAGLTIDSYEVPETTTTDSIAQRKDGKPSHKFGVSVDASCESAVSVAGLTTKAAIELWQHSPAHRQRLRWTTRRGSQTRYRDIYADYETGDMVIDAAGVNLHDTPVKGQTGLSATDTHAHNLRGIDQIPKPSAATNQFLLEFAKLEPDTAFALMVQPSWPTTVAVVKKTVEGVTVEFGTPPPTPTSTVDWVLVR